MMKMPAAASSNSDISGKAAKAARRSQRRKSRSGNCPRSVSTVRPVSSSFPAFMLSPNSDPLGFPGFASRGGFSGL